MSVVVTDKIYGTVEISEPVLCALLEAPSIVRLKGISQQGLPQEYYYEDIFSRYDHSVGVMLLLRRLGASLPEQIAGLLHDISHTVFSHVGDWVLGNPQQQSFQDDIYADFLRKSEIPNVVLTHGFDVEQFCDLTKYSLLEQEDRSLCADRVDYTLRAANIAESKELLTHLGVCEKKIAMDSTQSAWEFAKLYAALQRKYWAGERDMALYYVLGKLLQYALAQNIIEREDLWKTDDEVMTKLETSKDSFVQEELFLLKNIQVKQMSQGIELPRKFRWVDPDVIVDSKIIKLSSLSVEFTEFLKQEAQAHEKPLRVDISTGHSSTLGF